MQMLSHKIITTTVAFGTHFKDIRVCYLKQKSVIPFKL